MDIIDATLDEQLFHDTFGAESWASWRVALAAIFALACPEGEALDLYRSCTGRTSWPARAAREVWALIGRRGGKSRIAALVAVWLACFRTYRLAPGERGVVMLIAADRAQARIVLDYVRALLAHPMLAPLVVTDRAESIDLTNNVAIAIGTASYRTIRGRTVIGAVLDEVCFWRSEDAANPDVEVLAALRPAMASVPGALLVGISTPYSRRGVAWRAFSKHYGKDESDTLVWRAPSLVMNPSLAPEVIDAARLEDPQAAAAEWDAEWRSDVEALLDPDIVGRAVITGRVELPPVSGIRYSAFVDPSGGSHDSFTLCIAHRERETCVIDVLRERRPPFNPDSVTQEFAGLCRAYRISKAIGDRYAGAWVRERFQAHQVRYEPAPLSKSDLYAALLGQINSRRVELPDFPKLVSQLCALERRTARGTGRDSIDHPPGQHDDLANALAGAVHLVLGNRPERPILVWKDVFGFSDAPGDDDDNEPREPKHLGVFQDDGFRYGTKQVFGPDGRWRQER
jgi:hypothetical protein